MSDFYTLLEQYLGDSDAISDVRAVVRRCWFYDFQDEPLYLWQGKGTLITEDSVEWMGSIDNDDTDHHKTPAIQDGRDGTSATYTMSMNVPNQTLYEQLKAEQWRVAGRDVFVYLAIFEAGEGLRPATPIVFFKQLTMIAPRFSEKIDTDESGKLIKRYVISVTAKDANFGRASIPNGTYTDTIQKQRAKELGVSVDKGCEYVASLANRTLQLP